MKEDIVRKYIETLVNECFIFRDYMNHVYYYLEITKKYKDIIEDGFLFSHNSILRRYDSEKREKYFFIL